MVPRMACFSQYHSQTVYFMSFKKKQVFRVLNESIKTKYEVTYSGMQFTFLKSCAKFGFWSGTPVGGIRLRSCNRFTGRPSICCCKEESIYYNNTCIVTDGQTKTMHMSPSRGNISALEVCT